MDGKIFVEPENLVYKQDNQLLSLANEVNFRGFTTKVNNFYNNLDKFTSQQNAQIQKLELEITVLKSITGDNTPKYKRKDYLEALRENNHIVVEEIEKMSKQKDYKSSFVPKSAKDCSKTKAYEEKTQLHKFLVSTPCLALRLGYLDEQNASWILKDEKRKQLLSGDLYAKQKGIDMNIGIDIAT